MFGADDRGQAIQIGAVILFSFVVIGFSLYQATVVPDQNAQVEFNHNQEVQQDMLELRGGVLSAGASGSGTAVTVQLGAQYPARVLAVNPGAPSGSLRTVDPGGGSTLSIANAAAQNDETADFWSGTGTPREYTTHGVVYRPNYNEYREAPATVYENTVVYNRGPDGGVSVQTGQRLVSGRELDLTILLGSYQADQAGSVSVDVASPANEPRTVAVQRQGDPINVTAPTSLAESTWTDLLEPEFVANGGYVDGSTVSVRGGILSFELRETDASGDPVTYELQIPAAGIGTDVPDPTAAYVTDISGDGTSIPEGGTQQVVAEVRNEFNGPESGVSTCADLGNNDPGSLSTETDSSGEDGHVSFVYEAPNDVDRTESVTVSVSYDCDGNEDITPGASNEAVAKFEIGVLNSDGSGGNTNGGGNNNPPSVSIQSTSVTQQGNNNRQAEVDVTFDGSDPDSDLSTYTVTLYDSSAKSNQLDQTSASYSGGTITVTVNDTNTGQGDDPYYVVVTVTDSTNNSASDETSTT